MCEMYQSSNIEPCGLSEFILIPEWNVARGGVAKIPDSITYEQAALIEPVACCLRSIDKINIKKADNILIFGAGPTGLMHLILMKYSGVSQIILEFRIFHLRLLTWINFLVSDTRICFQRILITPDMKRSALLLHLWT